MLKNNTGKHLLLAISFCLGCAGSFTTYADDSAQSHSTSMAVMSAIVLTAMGPQSLLPVDRLLTEEVSPPLAISQPEPGTDVRQLFNIDTLETTIAADPALSELLTLFLRAKDAYNTAIRDSAQRSETTAAAQTIPQAVSPRLAKTLLRKKHERAVEWLEYDYKWNYKLASSLENQVEEFKATLRAESEQLTAEGKHFEASQKRKALKNYADAMDGHGQAMRNEADQNYKTRLPLVHSTFDRAIQTLRYREQALQKASLQQHIAQQTEAEDQSSRLLQLEEDYHQSFMALLEASRQQEDPASASLSTALRLRYQPGYTVPQSRIDYVLSMDAVEKRMVENAEKATAEAEVIAEESHYQDAATGNDETKNLIMTDMPLITGPVMATPGSTAAAEPHTGHKVAAITSPMAAIYPLEMRIDSGDTEETLMYRYLGITVESMAKHATSSSIKFFKSLTTSILLANTTFASSIVNIFAIEAGADFMTKDQDLHSTIAISALKALSRYVPYAGVVAVPLAGSELFMDMAKRFVHKASLADHSIELVDDDGLLSQIAYIRFNMPAQASGWYDHFFGDNPTTSDSVQDLTAVVPYIDVAPVSTESIPVTDNKLLISLHQLMNTLATNTSVRIFPLNATASAPGQLGYAFALVQMDESGDEHYSRLIEISGQWGVQGSRRWLTEALAARNLIQTSSLSNRLYDAVTFGSASLPILNPLTPELIQAMTAALLHYQQSGIDLWNGQALTFIESANTSPAPLAPAVIVQSGLFAAAMETGNSSTIFFDEFASQYQAPLRATLKYVGINQVDTVTLSNIEQQRVDRYPAVTYGMQPYNPVIARLHSTLYKTMINQAAIYAATELIVNHMFPVDTPLTFGLNGGGARSLPKPAPVVTTPETSEEVVLDNPVMTEPVVLDSPVMTEPVVLYPQATFDARHYTFGVPETTTEPEVLAQPMQTDGWWLRPSTKPLFMPKPVTSKKAGLKGLMETYKLNKSGIQKNKGLARWLNKFLPFLAKANKK